jgi:phosphatidylglycerophosphatase C
MTDVQTVGADTTDAGVAPRVVLFDFDGVLVRGDAYVLYVRDRFARSPWRLSLALLALPWLLPIALLSRHRAARTLVHIALLGLDEARYRVDAEAFAARMARRPRQFLREGLRELQRHRATGARVIVVTGCEQVLAARLLHELGLAELEVIGSELRANRLGMRVHRHNVGRRKVEALSARGVAAWQRAYGDSLHDVPMLRAAAEAVLVNPTPALWRKVEKGLGRAPLRVEWH